jgi:hypothetical protein
VVKSRRLARRVPTSRRNRATNTCPVLLAAVLLAAPFACTEDLRLPRVPSVTGTGGRTRPPSGGGGDGSGGDGGSQAQGGTGGAPDDHDAGSDTPPRDAGSSCRYLNGVQQQTPQVMITLDRSGSMFKKYGTSTVTRLQIVQQALHQLLENYSDAIHFGYVEFPVKSCQSGCCASMVIPPNPQTLSAIEKRWNCDFQPASCTQTTNDSPATQALRESRWFFEDEDAWPASRHVLLLTDDEPSCSASAEKNDCAMALLEVGKLSGANKVSTRVFGLTEELRASACLDMMATLGGNTTVGQLPASHRITTTGEQLVSELDHWFGELSQEACGFRLPNTLTPPQRISVRYDHRPVPHDPLRDDGWEYDVPEAPSRVIFYGSYCERLRLGSADDTEFSVCVPNPP